MKFANPRGSLLAALTALIVLLAGAALMTLNPSGITAGLRDTQHDAFSRLQPGVSATAPAGDLAPMAMSAIDTGIWASNAAAVWPELLFLLVTGAILVFLLARWRPLWAGLFTILTVAAALAGVWFLFAQGHVFVEVLMPVLVLGLSAIVGAAVHNALQPRRHLPVRAEVVPEVTSPQLAPAARPRRPAELRTVTYLAGELRGLVPGASPGDATHTMTLLDSAAAPLSAAISQNHGALVYSSGTRFAAVWNGPFADEDHAMHACEAALRMMSGLTQLKDQHGEGTPYDPLQLAVGIATGPAVVGESAERPDAYAITGNCVETAELLSKLSFRYGPAILVNEQTRDSVDKNFALLEVDSIAAEPDGQAMTVFALYGNPLVRASPKFRALSSFHDHLFQAIRGRRWSDAHTLIDQCNNLSGAIPQLYDLHLARVSWYESHPPPSDWDGAFRPPVV